MPEQLTKHPEVTLQVLRSAGAKCGEGAPQQILTQCAADRFCKLPGGEVCIYGLPEARQMTQVSAAEWQALMPSPGGPPAERDGADMVLPLAAALLTGMAIGAVGARRLARKPGSSGAAAS